MISFIINNKYIFMNNYQDNFITIIECDFCNNIKITNITFYIINIILIMSLIFNCIDYFNYFNNNIIYFNDSIYKDTDKDDDSQFINSSDYNNELNSSFDYDDSSIDDD